jgi:uncharacterized protein (TIGR02246 family)
MSGEDEIRQAEAQRAAALTRGDADAMAGLLADGFTYIHASGKADDRDAYIAFLRGGSAVYKAVALGPSTVQMLGDDLALMTGIIDVEVVHNGTLKTPHNRFSGLWVRRHDGWKLFHWHLTTAPAT